MYALFIFQDFIPNKDIEIIKMSWHYRNAIVTSCAAWALQERALVPSCSRIRLVADMVAICLDLLFCGGTSDSFSMGTAKRQSLAGDLGGQRL